MTAKWLTIVILLLTFHNTLVSAQPAGRFDVLITEIFADPNPSVGMPQNEFIEVQNVSSAPIDLKDWKFGDGNSLSTITVGSLLQPDSIAIICTNSAIINFTPLGKTIGVANFPSLDNDADLIFLRSKEGVTIHAVSYNKSWYKNDLKSNGGWSLEMIDTKNPCAGITNWSASIEATGGTPGRKNSIAGKNEDLVAPVLLRTYAIDSITIVTVFDEPIDSLTASIRTNYMLDHDNANPLLAVPVGPIFNEVILKFSHALNDRTVYRLTVSDITDCKGTRTNMQTVKTGLASIADESDIIINEILFNPKADGYDYFELYNKSKRIIDLQHLHAANKNATGSLNNLTKLSDISYLIFPEQFVVFTSNKRWLRQAFVVKEDNNVLELPSLPSLPDDNGTLVIVNMQGKIIEELRYDSKWHFALIENKEGISLERIDYSMPAQHKDNWTSAASTAGYGTPGYQNSQFKADIQMQGTITAETEIFSPDNDGFNDFVTISYQMTAPAFVANVTIFDASGRPVRYLVKNSTLGLQGSFRWDGLDDNFQRLPVGIYIVFTEIFNLRGKTKKFKNVVTLARKF
jgi:hypothetical protein